MLKMLLIAYKPLKNCQKSTHTGNLQSPFIILSLIFPDFFFRLRDEKGFNNFTCVWKPLRKFCFYFNFPLFLCRIFPRFSSTGKAEKN